ncbi:MAG: DUF997 family protein [Verrucomicrobiae bacterium]|nr:DUF997 family protein [Verrucomicrobiae bacterium]MCP5540736.1 DUF997 family protein [Akkermansiaceae bacterium]
MSEKPENRPDAAEGKDEDLGASYRQSRREMWVMLAVWAAFFLFVTGVCQALSGERTPDGAVPTLFGMPRWVAIGIALPWIAANVLIHRFCFHFMRDTPLGDEEES